jgi:uncharacterized protein (DUF1330 family)
MKAAYKLTVVAVASALLGATAATTILHAQSTAPAYIVADVHVTDPETMKQYSPKAAALIESHGGRFVARGGKVEVLEGEPPVGRVVLVQFPSMERAQQYWNSPAYREIAPIRQKAAKTRVFLVEGVAP